MARDARDDKVLNDFDQTNGLVDGLGGDDDGSLEGSGDETREDGEQVFPPAVPNTSSAAVAPVPAETDAERANDIDDDPAVTPYSEEGRR